MQRKLLLTVMGGWLLCGAAMGAANDPFGLAGELGSVAAAAVPYDGRGATRQMGEPTHDSDSSTGSLWWRWTAPASGNLWLRLRANGSDGTGVRALYTGNDLATLTKVAVSSNGTAKAFPVTAGTVYRLAVADKRAAELVLEFYPLPANDAFESRTALGSPPECVIEGCTVGATLQAGEPSVSSQGPTIWWSWQAPVDGMVSFNLTETSGKYWNVGVYTGEALGTLSLRYRRLFNPAPGTLSQFRVRAGEPLAIVASGDGSTAVGNVGIHWQLTPMPYQPTSATALDLGSSPTASGTADNRGGSPALWWRWMPPANGIFRWTVTRTDGGSHAPTLKAFDSNLIALPPHLLWQGYRCRAGQPVFLNLETYDYYAGTFAWKLSLLPAAANDDTASAAPLAMGDTAFDLIYSGVEPGEPTLNGSSSGRSLWWEWTAPATGALWFDQPTGSAYSAIWGLSPARAAIRSYSSPQQLLYLVAAGDSLRLGVLDSDHFENTPGMFSAKFVPRSTGSDAFANAEDLGSPWTVARLADPTGATREPGEPMPTLYGGSLWWKWTAPAACNVHVRGRSQSGSEFFGLWLYRGTSWGSLTANSSPAMNAGETLWIAVAAPGTGVPVPLAFELAAAPAHPNDAFADATDLGSVESWQQEFYLDATSEPGDPLGLPSLWWKWTAPKAANGYFQITGSGSRVAVFQGAALAGLTLVADSANTGLARFVAEAGATYWLAVAGSNAGPPYHPSLWLEEAPPGDWFAAPVELGSAASFTLSPLENSGIEPIEAGLFGAGYNQSLWWRWHAPADGRLVAKTLYPSSWKLFEETGGPGAGLRPVADEVIVAGRTYRIASLDGPYQSTAPATWTFHAKPINDSHPGALDLGEATSLTTTTNIYAATADATELALLSTASNPPNRGVWWRWTAPFDGTLKTHLEVPSIAYSYLSLTVLQGTEPSTWRQVGAAMSLFSLQAECEMSVTAGSTYLILAAGLAYKADLATLTLSAWPSPANNDWVNAIHLGSGSAATAVGSNVGATREAFEPNSAAASVWWRWTAPTACNATVAASIGTTAVTPAIYQSSNGLPELVDSSSCNQGTSWRAVAGRDYWIAVWGYTSTAQGEVRLSLQAVDIPPNDDFANRFMLPAALPAAFAGTTSGATVEPGELLYGSTTGSDRSASLWWSWTAPANGSVRLDLTGAVYVYVQTGATVDALTTVLHCSSTGSSAWTATAGVTYHFVAFRTTGSGGSFAVQLSAMNRATNDAFATPLSLGSDATGSWDLSTVQCTAEPGEPAHGGQVAARSLWFDWTAPAAGGYRFDAVTGGYQARLGIYQGSAVNALQTIASGSWRVGVVAVEGQTYRIAVDGTSGSGTLTLQPQPLPANDQFANRTVLPVTLPPVRGTTMLASMETGEPGTFASQPQRTLWWEWLAPTSTYLSISEVTGSNAGMEVYSSSAAAASFAALTFETSANYGGLYVTAGRRYYFRVFTRNNLLPSGVDFDFRIGGSSSANPPQPPNDDFANRTDLGSAVGIKITGDNYGATRETWDPSSTATLWWTWTAPADGVFGVRRTGTASVTLTIFTGTNPAALTTVAAGSGPVEWFRATAGTIYQIRSSVSSNIRGSTSSNSRFLGLEIAAGAPPANDDFAAAMVLPDPGTTGLDGSIAGASAQAGEPAHASTPARASVWYQWTASLAGSVQLATSYATMRAGIYQGNSMENLGQVATGNTPLTFTAVPGVTYRIALDAAGDESFVVRLNLPSPPVTPLLNDAFAAATELTGAAPESPGTTVGATMEPGEPYHTGSTSQSGSAWWWWTAPAGGAVTVSATGTSLAIYQGDTLGTLEPVVRGDNTVVFQVVGGVSYHIAAATPYSSSGNAFTVRLSQISESPANDAFEAAQPLTTQTTVAGTLIGASREAGESWHGSTPLTETVWYRWTAPAAGRARATLLAGTPGGLLVYRGDNVAALTVVATGTTEAGFSVLTGETFRIVVGRTSSGTAGAFELNVGMTDTGSNDDFANRTDLGAGPQAEWSGTAEDATLETGETPTETGGNGSRWWTWTAPADGGASLQLNEGRVVPAAYVYTGGTLGSLTLVASISGSPPKLAFPVRAGTTYQIALRATPLSTGVGDFRISLAWQPQPNDAQSRAQELASTLPVSASAVQAGAPALWWQWVAPVSGVVNIDFRMTEFSSNPSVWSGPGLPLLDTVPLTWAPSEVYRFTAVAGTRYWIRTSAQQSGYFGKVVFEIRPQTQLPNDLFADALPLAGERIVLDTVNFGAGTEPGEPLPQSRPFTQMFTRSLWWRWVAPRTGLLRVKITSGWAFLYEGASWAELREVAGPGGATSTSGAYFVEAGRSYFIAAGNTASGQVGATLELSPPGDRFADAENLGSDTWLKRAGTLVGCSWEPGEPLHGGSAALASRWFRWQAPAAGSFRITAMNGSAKLRVAIYQGDAISRLSEIASGLGTFTAEAGHTYQIVTDGGSQPGAYELVLEAELPGYAAWRDTWSAATDPASAPGADPDGDGRVNFLEFALGTPPLHFSAEPALTYDSDLGRVRVHVRRPADRDGIQYLIEVSNALNDWLEPAPERRSEVVTGHGDGTETLSVTLLDYRYENHPELFFRLRVAAPQ